MSRVIRKCVKYLYIKCTSAFPVVSAAGCRTPCLYRYPVVSATGRFIVSPAFRTRSDKNYMVRPTSFILLFDRIPWSDQRSFPFGSSGLQALFRGKGCDHGGGGGGYFSARGYSSAFSRSILFLRAPSRYSVCLMNSCGSSMMDWDSFHVFIYSLNFSLIVPISLI